VPVLTNPTVLAIGAKHNKSSAQVALRWVTQQGATAVTASDKASHDTGDLGIFDFDLTDEEMATLTAISHLSLRAWSPVEP
jgi:diketogulonate reductase-like aldo/keto reductase